MSNYVTGNTIKVLRENKGYTQKKLSEMIGVSDKTISKWETGRGLPDISLIDPLAKSLGVSVSELFSGECITNKNRSGNMLRSSFYVCPVCGNIIHSLGEGSFSCCGIALPSLEAEDFDLLHKPNIETVEYDMYITLDHPMTKEHYISFFAYVTADTVIIKKLYPEQPPECRFPSLGQGIIYVYCNHHGLFAKKV